MKRLFFCLLAVLLPAGSAEAAMSYGASYYTARISNVGSGDSADPLYLFINEVETAIEAFALEGGTYITMPTNGMIIDNSQEDGRLEFRDNSETFGFKIASNKVELITDSGVATFDFNDVHTLIDVNSITIDSPGFIRLTAHDTVPGAVAGTFYYDLSDNKFYGRNASAWVDFGAAATGAANLDEAYDGAGGSGDGKAVTVDSGAIALTATDAANNTVLVVTQQDTAASTGVQIVSSAATANTPALDIDGQTTGRDIEGTGASWYVTGAGAVTAASVTTTAAITSGTSVTAGNGLTVTTGNTAIGDNTGTFAVSSTGIDISTGGAVSGVTTLAMTDDLTMATGKGVKSSTTTAHSVGVYGYDTDGAYVGAVVVTNSATPATVLGNSNGTTAISSSDWTISTAGNMAGIGTITNDGLITASGGLTLTGATSINDSATTSATSIGAGTTTGTVTIGGTGTQAINIGNGAGIKTVALGSTNTTSTTTISSGSNGVNINANGDDPTNINTGTSTGTVSIGGTGVMTINIGQGGTGAKTITIGDAASTGSITVAAGTGDLSLSSVDDVTLNGGSNGSLINIGTNTHGNTFHIGDNDTTADTGTIGSAKDTWALAGIAVTVGSTGTTSTLTLQSGSGGVNINASNNQPTNIGNGTCTGDVLIGNGDTAQTVTIANGAGAKAVALGSTNTTSGTTISSGSGGLALNGPVAINTSKSTNTTNIGDGTTTGTITIGGTGTQTLNIGNGAGVKTVALGSTNSTSATTISSGSGDLDIVATAALDIDAGTTIDMLAAGAFSIDGSNAASNLSLATDNAGDNLTISLTGATDSHLIVSSAGTSADAITLSAAAGGISAGAASALVETTGAALGVRIDAQGVVAGNAIEIESTNGVIQILADGGTYGDILLDAEDDVQVTVGGHFRIVDDDLMAFGTDDNVTLNYDEDDEDNLQIKGPVELETTYTKFNQIPVFSAWQSAAAAFLWGGAATGATGDENIMMFPNGQSFIYHILGAGQTELGPQMRAGGFDISMDDTADEGVEIVCGEPIVGGARTNFTVGTDAFYLKVKIKMTDADGSDDFFVGFRKIEAFQTGINAYDTYAVIGNQVADFFTETELNGGGETPTDVTVANWADGETHTLEVYVSAAKAVTYKVDGVEPGGVQAFTWTDADVVVPFLFFLHHTEVADLTYLVSWECGLQ